MSFISSLPKASGQEKQNKLVTKEDCGITINPETNEIEASSIVKNFVTNGTDIEPYAIKFNDETDEAVRRMANILVSPTAINIMKSLEPKDSTGAIQFSEICIDEGTGFPLISLTSCEMDSDGLKISSKMDIYLDAINISVNDETTGNNTNLDISNRWATLYCQDGDTACYANFGEETGQIHFIVGNLQDGSDISRISLLQETIECVSDNIRILSADGNNQIISISKDPTIPESIPEISFNGYIFIDSLNRTRVTISSGYYQTYRTNDAEFLPDGLQYFDGVDSECLYIDHPVQVTGDLFFTADLNGVSHGHIRNVAMPEYDTDAAPAWYVHKVAEQYLPHIYPFIIATSSWTTPSDADKVKYPKVAAVKDLTIDGISSDQTQQLITVIPVESCMADYFDCGIMLIAESENTVRIACSKIPSSDMDITICVQPARSESGVN